MIMAVKIVSGHSLKISLKQLVLSGTAVLTRAELGHIQFQAWAIGRIQSTAKGLVCV